MLKVTLAAVAIVLQTASLAYATPVGLWKTIDDDTKMEKSLVRISETGGVYNGTVEKLLDPAKQEAKCDKCSDERKDKPVLGMTILRNLKQNADDKTVFDGGDIVDPNNGKIYRVRLKPLDDGKTLQMRGYIGPFYRTQVWTRVE